jgi:ferredoxin-thioredoxin reductase catalytic chain
VSLPAKTPEQTALFARMAAAHHGWKLNPDQAFAADLLNGLCTNFNRYGYFLCPCRDSLGRREADRDVICPCSYAGADIREYGHCYCALYLAESFIASGRVPSQIPERRPDV